MTKKIGIKLLTIFAAQVLLIAVHVVGHAATTRVTSIADLKAAIAGAKGGDTIVLADGVYQNAGLITVDARGKTTTSEMKLTVRAETPGWVVFTGDDTHLTILGNHVVLSGFCFRDIGGVGVLLEMISANYCTITECRFFNVDKYGGVLEIKGMDSSYREYLGPSTNNVIQRCWFDGCDNVNVEIFVVDEEHYPGPDLWNVDNAIVQCVFSNINGPAAMNSPIQIGRGSAVWGDGTRGYPTEQLIQARTRVERCLFRNCKGSSEVIQSKCSANVFVSNVFVNNIGHLSLRGGDDCLVDGNFFYEDGEVASSYFAGVRVNGSGHVIRNNYLAGAPSPKNQTLLSIVLYWGNGEPTGFIPNTKNVTIAHNTILNSTRGYAFYQPPSATTPPRNCTWVNNLGENANVTNAFGLFGYKLAGEGHVWAGNRGHVSSGRLASTGITTGVTDSGSLEVTGIVAGRLFDYYYPIRFGRGVENVGVDKDIYGNPRPSPPAIGCDEPDGPEIGPANVLRALCSVCLSGPSGLREVEP